MSRRFKSILLFIVILMQTTILPHFTPLSVIPNYTLVFTIAITVISADTESVILAALTGLMMDLFTGAPVGLNTLLYMYIAIFLVMVSAAVYNKRLSVVVPMCFVSSFVHELLFGILSSLLRGAEFYPYSVIKVVIPVAFVNGVIFVPVYFILSKIKFEKKRKGIKYEH